MSAAKTTRRAARPPPAKVAPPSPAAYTPKRGPWDVIVVERLPAAAVAVVVDALSPELQTRCPVCGHAGEWGISDGCWHAAENVAAPPDGAAALVLVSCDHCGFVLAFAWSKLKRYADARVAKLRRATGRK